jgi:Acyl-CoA dehydrogenases
MLVTDEQQQIADAVKAFAQERLKPFAEQWDKAHRFPKEAIGEMAELGLFGMLVPEQWGGSDTGYVAYAMAPGGDRRRRRRLFDHHERAQLGGLRAYPALWQ